MTTISATVVADSVGHQAPRLTTFRLRYPRWIHAEGRTHRVLRVGEDLEVEVRTPSLMEDPDLSRNASSSRAIPVSKMIQDVLDDPAIPLFWGKNQKGMQASEDCNAEVEYSDANNGPHGNWGSREDAWRYAIENAVAMARSFDDAGYHKQIVNRLLEPFSHITVVVTGTQWSNFYALRRHADAEPHIKMLADRMWDAQQASYPTLLEPGQWHLPFVDAVDANDEPVVLSGGEALQNAIKLSVARCASTSYKTVDGFDMTLERAVALHDKLVASTPLHVSPAEHQAQVPRAPLLMVNGTPRMTSELGGNLGPGWVQYRKTLPGESL